VSGELYAEGWGVLVDYRDELWSDYLDELEANPGRTEADEIEVDPLVLTEQLLRCPPEGVAWLLRTLDECEAATLRLMAALVAVAAVSPSWAPLSR
jgi:hypothetical protein